MITIFNQMEVYVGYRSPRMISVMEELKSAGIRFKCRVFSDSGAHLLNRNMISLDVFNVGEDKSKIYHVYVHKRDHDAAREILFRLDAEGKADPSDS